MSTGVRAGDVWARAETMGLWAGEDYYLQIDSHMRFAQDWDTTLIGMCELTPGAKPVLSTFCPSYTPGHRPPLDHAPIGMSFERFVTNGGIGMKPSLNPPGSTADLIRARFLCAHFIFAVSSFVEEVPYDPQLYFFGEEITLAIRAFTSGYDLYHPTQTVLSTTMLVIGLCIGVTMCRRIMWPGSGGNVMRKASSGLPAS